jgi:hypothetical protein
MIDHPELKIKQIRELKFESLRDKNFFAKDFFEAEVGEQVDVVVFHGLFQIIDDKYGSGYGYSQ